MMNVTSKSTAADEAGVLGLMAFLADPEKCEARMFELRSLADMAEAAQNEATKQKAEAADKVAFAERLQMTVEVAVQKTAEAKVVVQSEMARLQEKDIALSAREAAIVEEEQKQAKMLDAMQIVQNELSMREVAINEELEAASMFKTEYETKLAKLRSFTAE